MVIKNKLLKSESGQSMVLIAFIFVVLCVFTAFTVDLGRVSSAKGQLQNASDAAAVAGAQDLPSSSTARSTAIYYAGLNGVEESDVTATSPYNGDSSKIEVVCTETVSYTFARIFGFTSTEISVRSVAQKGGISDGVSGLRPWALVNQYEEIGGTKKNPTYTWVDYNYTYGLEFELKAGGGGGSNGFFGAVGYGTQNPNSANVYKDNITNGYDGIVNIGDTVLAGSGNMNVKQVINALLTASGDTAGDYTKATNGNSRVVIVPKIDAQTLEVIGFAVIYLKSVDNQGYITANFLYDTTWSDAEKGSLEDWGLNSNIRLSD